MTVHIVAEGADRIASIIKEWLDAK